LLQILKGDASLMKEGSESWAAILGFELLLSTQSCEEMENKSNGSQLMLEY
jgi:hypothetical protein